MRLVGFLVLAAATGCNSIVGEWEGECAVQVGNDLYIYEVEMDIESVEKGDINGTGTLYDQDNQRSQGTLDGTQEGKDLDFDIKFEDGVLQNRNFEIDAEFEGREMNGDCQLGGQHGLLELERVG
jgi:hypothetical protein